MKKSARGFTLIELLVTMSIIGILFGIGYAKYNEFNRRQILAQAAQELKNNLRFAQDKAMAGEKDCSVGVCGGDDGKCGTNDANEKSLDGWFLNPGVNDYQVFGTCGGQVFNSRTINLSNRGITIPSPPSAIHFKPLGQGVEGASTITLSGLAGTEDVIVTETGEIK